MRDHTPSRETRRRQGRRPEYTTHIADIARAAPVLLAGSASILDCAPWNNGADRASRDDVVHHVVEFVRWELGVNLQDKPTGTAKNLLTHVGELTWVHEEIASRVRFRLQGLGVETAAAGNLAAAIALNVGNASRSDMATSPWEVADSACPLDDIASLVLRRVLPLVGVWARVHAVASALLVPEGLGNSCIKELREVILAGGSGQSAVALAIKPRLGTAATFRALVHAVGRDLDKAVDAYLADRINALRKKRLALWTATDRIVATSHIEALCRDRPGLAAALEHRAQPSRGAVGGTLAFRTLEEELAHLERRMPWFARRWSIPPQFVEDVHQEAAVSLGVGRTLDTLLPSGSWRIALAEAYRAVVGPRSSGALPADDVLPDHWAHIPGTLREDPRDVVSAEEFTLLIDAAARVRNAPPEVRVVRYLLNDPALIVDPATGRERPDAFRRSAYDAIEQLRIPGDRDAIASRARRYLRRLCQEVLPATAERLLDEHNQSSARPAPDAALVTEEGLS